MAGFEVILGTRRPVVVAEEEKIESRMALLQFAAEFDQLSIEPTAKRHIVLQDEESRRITGSEFLPECQMAERAADHAPAVAEIIAAEGVLDLGSEGQRPAINGGKPDDARREIGAGHVRQAMAE